MNPQKKSCGDIKPDHRAGAAVQMSISGMLMLINYNKEAEMSEKEPRRELTAAQIGFVETTLMQFFPLGSVGIDTNPEKLLEVSAAMRATGDLLHRAAEKHRGQEPSWKQFCEALLLPPAVSQIQRAQNVLEPLVGLVGIKLVRGSGKKGDALPGFRVVNGAGQKRAPECCDGCGNADHHLSQPCPYRPERGRLGNWICTGWRPQEEVNAILEAEAEQHDPASDPVDLTLLDYEPENRSECDRFSTEINMDNEGVVVDGSLLCAKCHADEQLPRCSWCGEAGELSPDDSGDLVCKDCLRADETGEGIEHIVSCVQCSTVVDLNVAGSGEIIPDVGVMCERCLNKDAGEPEICAGCGKQYSTCCHQPGCQDCEGFEK